MQVDYIIVGQGLAGTLVGYNLIKQGKKVAVFDELRHNSSSRVAAGLYNPITGPRALKTWLADDLFPFLEEYYTGFEHFLGVKFLHKKPIFRPFDSIAEQNNWYGQSADEKLKNFVSVRVEASEIQQHYVAPYGGIQTKLSGYLDVKSMLNAFSDYLRASSILHNQVFDYTKLKLEQNGVSYEDISAERIIFCEGHHGRQNPFFSFLPLNGTKGQVLEVEIENYDLQEVLSKGIFVLPEKNGKIRVGSNYEWQFEDEKPSEKATLEIAQRLEMVLKSNYKILGVKAGVRPTTKDRRPLIGQHPEMKSMYIFNGLGTKGVSVAPFFSSMFASWLNGETPLSDEVNITRFKK